jgi:hypothetical protein
LGSDTFFPLIAKSVASQLTTQQPRNESANPLSQKQTNHRIHIFWAKKSRQRENHDPAEELKVHRHVQHQMEQHSPENQWISQFLNPD